MSDDPREGTEQTMSIAVKTRIRQVASFALALVMAGVLFCQAAAPAYADDKQQELEDKKNQAQQELEEIRNQQSENQENLENAQAQKEQLEAKNDELKQEVANISNQIDELEIQIGEKEDDITAKQAEVDQKQAEFDERWAGFKERMSSMQMLHYSGGIDILSNASNLFQLLNFAQALSDISEKDEEICQQLDDEKAALNQEKQDLENQKAQLEAQEATLADNKNQLDGKIDELVANIQQQDATISEAEARAQALAAAETEKQAEFNKAADELDSYLRSLINNSSGSNPALSCSLNFICPLGSYKYISCEFGDGGHKGRDYAAPGGTPIKAVASGQVITVAWHDSYGYYVMVYHGTADDGNNYTTLYAHMQSWPPVSVGQTVSQGDVIGYVGSTGNSTGNHLHLELRQNGSRINPALYIPG